MDEEEEKEFLERILKKAVSLEYHDAQPQAACQTLPKLMTCDSYVDLLPSRHRYPTSIQVRCKGRACTVEGDLVARNERLELVKNEINRIMETEIRTDYGKEKRAICRVFEEHGHGEETHIHFLCKPQDSEQILKVVEKLAVIDKTMTT